MPVSVHKILMHGADVIRNTILPIGIMREEASEARNKDYRKFRADRSRKHSRIVNMEDVFHRLMDTSDPLISSINLDTRIRNVAKMYKIPLPQEVRNLLTVPLKKSNWISTQTQTYQMMSMPLGFQNLKTF